MIIYIMLKIITMMFQVICDIQIIIITLIIFKIPKIITLMPYLEDIQNLNINIQNK